MPDTFTQDPETIVAAFRDGHEELHKAVHIATYVLIGVFLWSNRRLPGVKIIGLGAFLNALVITLNGGQMAASRTAERLAGLHLDAGFENSAPLAHPHLLWFGDVIPWPGPFPNVLSIGDLLIYAGTLILLHRICRRRSEVDVTLSPVSEPSLSPGRQPSR